MGRACLAVGPAFPERRRQYRKHVPGVMRRQYICSLSNGRLFLSVVVGVHHSMSSAMNVLSAFRSLALLSLSVNSTEQRLMRSHLELFSREHVWGKNEENVYVLQSPNF